MVNNAYKTFIELENAKSAYDTNPNRGNQDKLKDAFNLYEKFDIAKRLAIPKELKESRTQEEPKFSERESKLIEELSQLNFLQE